MQTEAILVKAFTKDPSQGNPAGVILDANNLSPKKMIGISADLGFSESAFVTPSDKADFRVRFFSSKQEVPLCGHATIATFHTLIEQGQIKFEGKESKTVTQETIPGVLPVTCHKKGLVVMTQAKPIFFKDHHDRKEITKLLNLQETDLGSHPIQLVSTGTPKLMIPVRSLDALFSINPNLKGISQYCEDSKVRGFYPFTHETKDKHSDFHARQFNPLAGIDEDPITGSAAGALAAYIVKHRILHKTSFVIEQGYILNKYGKVHVEVDNDIRVGGYAVRFGIKKLL